MNPRSSTPSSAEDAGLGSPSRRDRLRRVGAGLLAFAAIGLLTPTVAHADGGKTPEIEGLAYYVLGEPRCFQRPDSDAPKGTLSPRPGSLYEVSAAAYKGHSFDEAGGLATFRYAQEPGVPERGCFVAEDNLSSVLPSDPSAIQWIPLGGLMGAVDSGGSWISGFATRGVNELLSAPTTESEILDEPDNGTLLDVPVDFEDWQVLGDWGGDETRRFIPVRLNGILAWARFDSVTEIPTIDLTKLTGDFTAMGPIDVVLAPTPFAQTIGALTSGQTVKTSATQFLGYQPVLLDTGEIGWISQEEALAAAVVDPVTSATPTAEATPWGERADALVDEFLGDDESDGSLIDQASAVLDEVKEKNPVAKAAAKTALLPSSVAAAFALLLLAAAIAARARFPFRSVATGVVGLIATFVAASLAPTAFFQPQVMAGVGVLGLTLGFTVASTVASLRGVPLAGVGEVLSNTNRLLVVLAALSAPIAFSVLSAGLDWPVGGLLGLLLAGAAVGFLVKPERAAAELPAYPTGVEVAPAASDPSFESGW